MVERRLTWLALVIALWGVGILGKLVSLQAIHHREYARRARSIQQVVVQIAAPRGTIFDRNAQPLAMSLSLDTVTVNPQKIQDISFAAELLSLLLHLNREELEAKIQTACHNGRGYLRIKRGLTPAETESMRKIALVGIALEHESQRHYPKGGLAAHVIGGVDFQEKGNAGIEKALDAELRGTPGKALMLTDVKRRGIEQTKSQEAHAGTTITLTIDERLQFIAERELAKAVAEHRAQSGSLVVMDPYNGDILALASFPTYDPNMPPEPGESPGARLNHAVSVPFEPGSVFKVITLSAALETTNLNPESPINCNGGKITLFGRTIHDSHAGMGVVPMKTVLAKSSNVGAIQVGMKVGQTNLYQYVRRFGFGKKTGIPLPAESAGKVRKLERWGKTSLSSVAMGQEVSVTTLQLAQAASVIANGGFLVKPRLLLKRGNQTEPAATPIRVMKADHAITMRQMMEGVVLVGSGIHARLAGYSSGGKTGSAQIFDFATRRYTHNYNGSYMGFAPLTNPRAVTVVTLNGTHGGEAGFGGRVAAPTFKVVMEEALRILDVPKDLPESEELQTLVARNGDVSDLADAGADTGSNILEDGDDDAAPAGAAVTANMNAPNGAAPGAVKSPAGPTVPNFRGKTMRAVLAEAAAKGLIVIADGSGIARVQSPAPGTPLREGDRVRVQFAR
jgi:cell division protein FtsI (penicillin-binding protein 3)